MAFGLRNPALWWSFVASAIVHSYKDTKHFNVTLLPEADEIARNLQVRMPPPGESADRLCTAGCLR